MMEKQSEVHKKAKSGLNCYVLPMADFGEKMAAFVVHTGSNDLSFLEDKRGDVLEFPKGTAHFLEHKLFRQKWGDAFTKFGEMGANANAFTDGEKTVYYFACRRGFLKNLRLLLEFVGETYFLSEEIKAEQNIIQREIQMYDDNPDWIGYYRLLEAMYAHHPVRNPIAGTVESVEDISAEILQKAYDCLYTSDRFSLICGGDVPVEKILKMTRKIKDKPKFGETIMPTEPKLPMVQYVEQNMGLGQPQFQIGCKLDVPEDSSKRRVEMMYFLELLLGETSDFYTEAYTKKYLEEPMGGAYFAGRGYAFFACTGKGVYAKEVMELLQEKWKNLQKSGIREADFLRIQKKLLGGFLRMEQSVSSMVFAQVDWASEGKSLAEVKALLEAVEKEHIEKLLQNDGFPDKMVLSVIR